tara:strand:- start:1330 stop:3036 length:1707 start_codon:yes stop_codon:yes gene_type:complete
MNYEKKLTELGFKLDGLKDQKTKCPKCQPPHNPRDFPVSMTFTDKMVLWNCHHCGYKGGIPLSETYKPLNIETKSLEPVFQDKKYYTTEMYKFFSERGLSKQTVDFFQVYIKQNGYLAFPFYDEHNEIKNIKYRAMKEKRFAQTKNGERYLYNYPNVKESNTVIFVEGEMDVLALKEVGFENATTLPDGAPNQTKFSEDDKRFKCLENCPIEATKIILFTDSDQAGQNLHDELLHRFGKDICWYVEKPSDCKDANEVLLKHGSKVLRNIIDNAIPYPIEGVYTANQYNGSVLDLYNGNYVKPIEVGFPNLDRIYKIMKGTFHCITGIPNHGKSYFMDLILIEIAKKYGWKYAIFSPEHSTSMHIRRLAQMFIEKPFDEGERHRMSPDELRDAISWINEHFYFIESKESVPDIDYLLEASKKAVRKYGCNGIIIDPYNEVSANRKGNAREDEHIRDFISKCKRFARLHDVVMWIVAHPTKLPKNNEGSYSPPTSYDISGASHWSNQSDVIITVHRDFETDVTTVYTRKIREQDLYGQIGTAQFQYDKRRKTFVEYSNEPDWSVPHWTED